MNYTPNDLENITFKKSIMGYSEDAVNEVLDKVIEDYSAYIHENIELKDKVAILNEGMQHYKKIEESLQNTLIIAQQTGEEIKKNSYEKADLIVKEAEIKVQKLISDANSEVIRIKYEYEDLRKKLYIYKTKAETLLLSQLELMKQTLESDDE